MNSEWMAQLREGGICGRGYNLCPTGFLLAAMRILNLDVILVEMCICGNSAPLSADVSRNFKEMVNFSKGSVIRLGP